MSKMLEDINHLSREIGARPKGTEEERLAAMYIAENIQKRSGLPFDIEDFEKAIGRNNLFNILSIVSAILLFVAILLPVISVPAFVITLAILVIATFDILEKPLFPNVGKSGISQNVVAKYIPTYSSESGHAQRKRKVVIVSRYDSGKAYPGTGSGFLKTKTISHYVSYCVDILVPLFLLIKMLAFPETSGGLTLFCVVLCLIFLIGGALPTLISVYENRLLYNEGANCNASGNAVLMHIAKLLGTGQYAGQNDEKQRAPRVAGEDQARQSGVIPQDVSLNYEADINSNAQMNDPVITKEQTLANAKAAVAAFTAPRAPRTQYDDEGNVLTENTQNTVNAVDQSSDAVASQNHLNNITIDDASAARRNNQKEVTSSIPAYRSERPKGEVPDWFKSAQSKAKKEEKDIRDVEENEGQRSRFAHTMDVMAQKQEDEARKKQEEEEKKREKLRQQIIAANKAADEERQKKFGEDKPFFRNEDDQNRTQAMPAVKPEVKATVKEEASVELSANKVIESVAEEVILEPDKAKDSNLSIDERFKKRQQESVKETKKDDISDAFEKSGNIDLPGMSSDEDIVKESFSPIGSTEAKSEKPSNSQPNLRPEHSGPIDLGNEMKQYAPLSDQEFISSTDMPDNAALAELPEVITGERDIESNPEYAKKLKETENISNTSEIERGKFGTGSFAAVSENEGVAGATGTFAPVTEELIEDASKSGKLGKKEDMIVDDADDTVYNEGSFTDTGAFAGKGYVDMPDQKRKGLFGLFSKSEKNSGKHSGGVENRKHRGDSDSMLGDGEWEGGAFSGIGQKISNIKDNASNKVKSYTSNEQAEFEEENYDQQNFALQNEYIDAPITSDKRRIRSNMDPVPEFDQQIQDFHNVSINLEVWLVALGSEVDENAGMRSFLLEHSQELRGAIIVDIEALGAGELSLINSEGLIKKSSTPSRLKRYIRQAANKVGVAIPSVDMPWTNSSAAFASKCGYKTIRLAGMEDGKPALYMDKDDVVENIDESVLNKNTKYLMELIQCI